MTILSTDGEAVSRLQLIFTLLLVISKIVKFSGVGGGSVEKKAQKLSSHNISIGFYFSGMWMSLIRERKKFCFYLDQNALDVHKTHHQKIYLECQQF